MKKLRIHMMTAAVVAAPWLTATSGTAQELYKVVVSAVTVATNSAGGLSYHGFGNGDIIRHCAAEQGLTNLHALRLVYDRTADALEVVTGTNHMVVCTPITFFGGVSVSKTNDTVRERLAWVFLENNPQASGTLRAREHYTFGPSNEVTHFNLSGRIDFAMAADPTNAARLYSGSISVAPHFDRDHDGD